MPSEIIHFAEEYASGFIDREQPVARTAFLAGVSWQKMQSEKYSTAPENAPVAWMNYYAGMPPRIDSAATAGALRSRPLVFGDTTIPSTGTPT